MPDQIPPPGSAEAIAQGCTCTAYDHPPGDWVDAAFRQREMDWEAERCPVHSGTPEPRKEGER